jgi:hypothetical protein
LLFLLGLFTRPQEHYRRCRCMILRAQTVPSKTISVAARSTACRRFATKTTGC